MLNLTSQVSNLRPMGHNLAREAFLYGPQQSIFALLMDSCHYNITIRFAGGQQSSENTRTTFDNDFCRSCHCKTDGILPRTLDRKLFKISLSNFSQFSQRSYAFSLRSLLMTYTLGCLPISIYFCSWPLAAAALWAGALCQQSGLLVNPACCLFKNCPYWPYKQVDWAPLPVINACDSSSL